MSRATFRQADVERIIRAARREKALLHIDIRSLVVTVTPIEKDETILTTTLGEPFGEENWDTN